MKGINNPEPHVIILWQPNEYDKIYNVINDKFKIIKNFRVPCLTEELGDSGRRQILDALYRYDGSSPGTKGQRPFHVFVIEDKNPIYSIRDATRVTKPVNLNTYELKHHLRQGRSGYIHATDNLEEVHDNLMVLSHLMNDSSIYKIWEDWRPKFKGMSEFFEKLHSSNQLEYVIMRNFDHYPEAVVVDEHTDIDILVNDYFLFKSLVGGKNRKKPAYEDGGFKVANLVHFGGEEITVDTRSTGDDYYCKQWQIDMLNTRQLVNGFYIMNDENHFYSLLYHALCHKNSISETYKTKFLKLCTTVNLSLTKENVSDRKFLFKILNSFMERKGYNYVNPREKSIPCRRS